MLKILILGGSGILSTAVAQEAVNRGYDVTCLTTGRRDSMLPKGVKSIHGNANDPKTFVGLLENQYDAIVDFLSYTKQQLSVKLEELLVYTSQFVFISSATAYKLVDNPITEETPLGNPYWDYSENKIVCEKMLINKCNSEKKNYTIIRPYITYGNTRIPFGIIADRYWSLANRILCNKPVLLWDNGAAVCTLTHTSDFAKGVVSTFGNNIAYNQAFHVTSQERLTWREVLNKLSIALGKDEKIFSAQTRDILYYLPEYEGVLTGDKGRNRIFDNSKICAIEPQMAICKPFSEGIKETVAFFQNNASFRVVDYIWDGRIDATILKLAKDSGIKIESSSLRYRSADKSRNIKDFVKYCIGRYDLLYFLYSIRTENNKKDYIRGFLKKVKPDFDVKRFHHFGFNVNVGKCDFGNDLEMISIGNNIKIMDGTKFIVYRPTAEFFNVAIGDGTNKTLRELGKINVEDNTYIGYDVKIFPGVTIGKDSLVLDGSVVYEDVPPSSVVGGNPATVISSIEKWYEDLLEKNKEYTWYEQNYDHDRIIKERERYFFEEKNENQA